MFWCRAALALALVLGATPVQAAVGVRLLYLRDAAARAGCPDESELRRAVTAQLGYDPFGEGPLTVLTSISRAGDRLDARIELSDETGQPLGSRALSGRDCAELGPAVELVLGLAVGPLYERALAVAQAAPPPTGPPPASQPTAPAGQPATGPASARAAAELAPLTVGASPAPVTPGERRREPRFRVGAGVGVALDSAPAPAVAIALSVALLRRHFSLGLELRGDLPAGRSASFDGRVETTLVVGELAPCLRHRVVELCLLVALGGEHAETTNYANPRQPLTFYAALGGRLAIELPLASTIGLRLQADLLAPVTHSELYVGQVDAGHLVYRTPSVGSVLGLLFVALFP